MVTGTSALLASLLRGVAAYACTVSFLVYMLQKKDAMHPMSSVESISYAILDSSCENYHRKFVLGEIFIVISKELSTKISGF